MNIGQCHTLAHRNQQLSTTRFEAIRLRPDWAKAHSRKALSLLETLRESQISGHFIHPKVRAIDPPLDLLGPST